VDLYGQNRQVSVPVYLLPTATYLFIHLVGFISKWGKYVLLPIFSYSSVAVIMCFNWKPNFILYLHPFFELFVMQEFLFKNVSFTFTLDVASVGFVDT